MEALLPTSNGMKTTVAVLRGGPSSEYEVSLRTGAAVLRELDPERFHSRDIFIDREGQWHLHGAPVLPERALRGADAVFNVVHGEYGEDGRLHNILDALNVPYTGPGRFETAQAFNKHRSREAVSRLGIQVARGVLVAPPANGDMEEAAHALFRSFSMPAVVKPVIGGSSVGITLANDFHSLAEGLSRAFEIAPKALVEEYVRGREATVGVIDHFRGEKSYALLPVEIIPPASRPFFDYDAKYSGETQEICPGNFSAAEKDALMSAAKAVHENLGMRDYSRSDFIVNKRGIYFLEVNSAPAVGLTEGSLLPKAIAAVGSRLSEFLEHIIELARGRAYNR